MTDPRELGRLQAVDPDAGETMPIAGRSYLIVPQKLGRLRSHLGVIFSALAGAAQAGEQIDTASILRSKPYELLQVFIPDLEPEWKLWGALTEESYAAGQFDDDAGATFPELHTAFLAALRVNHFDLLAVLGKLINTDLLVKAINVQIAGYLEQTLTSSSSPLGPASASPASRTTPLTSVGPQG